MTSGRGSPPEPPGPPKLDNLTLSRKEGWNHFVNAAPRAQPEHLGVEQLKKLGGTSLVSYNQRRRKWHANLGPIKTPQLQGLHEDLWDIIDSNDQDGDKAKGAIAIDAFPGLGKTTSILAFAREFHRREIREAGEYTDQGQRRLPVCRVGLNGDIGMKDFNRAMLQFFGHPGTDHGTSNQLSGRALDCVLSCETKLFVVDDLHFLKWRQTNGNQVSNHFKYIANEFPVTLLFAGVGLAHRGMFSEGESYEDAILAQSGRRTTPLAMSPFLISSEAGRSQWRDMLLAVEQRLVLARKHQGMVADDLSDYLFARSTGHIGSLMTIINRGCQRAVRTGTERLSADLLDHVKNDAGAEAARTEMVAALETGRLTSKPRRHGPPSRKTQERAR